MTFGLSEKHFQIVQDLAINPLKLQGAHIWIFGSRARGDHRPFSDLDILFKANRPLPSGLLGKINESLEESHLPIKVDIVEESDLAESYKENVFRDRVELTYARP